MPNIAESVEKAAKILNSAAIPDSGREAVSLLCFALGRDRAFLIAHPEYELQADEKALFDSVVQRRSDREPFHHITGVKEFYGLDFLVSPDVLIPRPETEMLVVESIGMLTGSAPAFCEIGVGSGCIAVSVLYNIPLATAAGLDISAAAIAMAHRNAERHHVGDRLRFLQSDVFGGLREERFDLIVSNPPYIPVDDITELQREVRDFEPHLALTDGGDGLSVIEKIVRQSPEHLKPGGFLLLEIGIGQSDVVNAIFDPKIWADVEILPDFQGIPRIVCAGLILR